MKTRERKQLILETLRQQKRVMVPELIALTQSSGMTIRRDLRQLEDEHIITRIHGGAVYNEGTISLPSVRARVRDMDAQKSDIANYCAGLVQEGNAVYLDAGSTNIQIAEALASRQNIAVMTHSLPIMNILSHAKGIQLFSLSGIYNDEKFGFFGEMTRQQILRFRIDLCFFGTHGVSIEDGIMLPDLEDVAVKNALLERSYTKILVTDHAKIDRPSFAQLCPITAMDKIVTDKEADVEFVRKAQRLGLEVVQV